MKRCIQHGSHWSSCSLTAYDVPIGIFTCKCGAKYEISRRELVRSNEHSFYKCPECGALQEVNLKKYEHAEDRYNWLHHPNDSLVSHSKDNLI